MKKIFMVLCALTMVAMVACKKDKPEPTPTPGPDPQQQRDLREGAYDPLCHITNITYSNGTDSEVWTWEDGKLQHVNQDVLFSYRADGRVENVELHNIQTGGLLPGDGLSGTMGVNYDGDYISSLTVVNNGTEVLTAQVQHNSAKKVSGATIDLSDNMLVELFNALLAQFIADSTASDNMITGVDNVTGNVLFTWNGDNVSQALLNIGFRAATTLGTLVNVVGEENLGMFGEYGSTLALLATLFPNQPLYFNVAVGDTVDYTYDNKVNPYRHYLGRLDISALTANNVVTAVHNGIADVTITTAVNGQSTQLYQTSYELPLESTFNEYLEYNAAGCPLRVEDANGNVIQFQYAE